jgi:hypothetical protein
MNQYKYLRAFMAGITVPTIVLLFGATAFCVARYVYNVPVPIERVIVFPMAVVPNLWGLWNMLFVASRERTHLSVGVHGALLPLLIGPLGFLLTRVLDFPSTAITAAATVAAAVTSALVALTLYYLVWKHIVGFLNALLGVA